MYPYPENMTGIVSWGQYTNTVTNGLFWPLMLLFLGSVMFMSTLSRGEKKAFLVSSIFTFSNLFPNP